MSKQPTKPSDNKMLALLGKTAILCIIPKTIDTVYDAFFGTTVEPKKKDLSTYTKAEVQQLLREQQELMSHYNVAPSVDTAVTEEAFTTPTLEPERRKEGTHSIGNSIVKSAAANANRVTKDTFSKPRTEPAPKKPRKKNDMTPLTKQHIDVVLEAFTEYQKFNLGKSQKEGHDSVWLAKHLNELFNLHKSYGVYSNVIRGHINRETAPEADYDIFNPPVVK